MKVIGRVPPILLYFLISLSTLTETVYSAALPQIAEQLNTLGSIAQLSTTVYYTGFSVGIFTLGRISDFYGRRPVILFGIAFYTIATLLISFSTNIEIFITLRFAQAYGASVGSVVAQTMARDSFKGWELSYIYTSVSMIMAFVPSIGSAIGGYIIEYLKYWEYIFYFLVIFSSILGLIYFKFLPETNPHIGQVNDSKFYQVLLTAIKDKKLITFAIIVGVYNGLCFGFYIQAPFIFIERLQMSPSAYGKLFLFLTISNLSGGLIALYMISKYISTQKIMKLGLILSIIGCISLLSCALLVTQDDVFYASISIFVPMAIQLMGHAMIVPMLLRHAIEDYGKVTGTAGSIFGSMYYLITAAVSFMIATFHSTKINNFAYLFAFLLALSVVLFVYRNNTSFKNNG